MQSFDDFFRAATMSPEQPDGCVPHGFQRRLALQGLTNVVRAPTGTGKTGIILAWLWRRMYGPALQATPRRLVYALPQRSLVEQTAGEAARWLRNLNLIDTVALHVVMGGTSEHEQRQWRLDMHKPAIVIGTVDSLVSKALNRGYGIGRAIYPIDFALVTNGAHWVVDEIQLCQESTTTLRQLASFAGQYETAEPFGLTCMSATIRESLLGTVDNPEIGDVTDICPEERTGELAIRLNAARRIRRLDADPGDYEAIAMAAAERHRSGELTMVVLNTVGAARAVHKFLRKQHSNCTLLHSRFRPIERSRLMEEIGEGRIVVATQVVEAGMDLNAAILITEAAPWLSIVQRAGRCNRTGKISDAELWWIPPKSEQPYGQADVGASSAALAELEGQSMTSESLLACEVQVTERQVAVLRRPDFIMLFDTSMDLSGNDIDITPYVRDTDDLDAQLAWATWTPESEDGAPPPDSKVPKAEYRCRVSLGQVSELAKKINVWRFDQVLGRWTRVRKQAKARPGEVLVVNAADGGYDPVTGFDPSAKGPVPDCPSLNSKAEPSSGAEDAYGEDSSNVRQREWMKLDVHSEQVRAQAAKLLDVIKPDLPEGAAQSAATAAYLHDVGKAHEIWQDAICDTAPDDQRDERSANRPWAKSGNDKSLRFANGVAFRHELASLLMLDGPLNDLLAEVPDADLVRYLVLAHHGKLRLQVRDPGDLTVIASGEAAEDKILGLKHGATTAIPPMLGRREVELTVDLDQFKLGGERSWTRTVLALRDAYGPFRLAYLEAIVRVADWRASAEMGDPE